MTAHRAPVGDANDIRTAHYDGVGMMGHEISNEPPLVYTFVGRGDRGGVADVDVSVTGIRCATDAGPTRKFVILAGDRGYHLGERNAAPAARLVATFPQLDADSIWDIGPDAIASRDGQRIADAKPVEQRPEWQQKP